MQRAFEGIVIPESAAELFVPGRVCLLGEHSDWAGESLSATSDGECLVYNTDVGIHAWAWENANDSNFTFIESLPGGGLIRFTAPMDSKTLAERASDPKEYFAYVSGTASVMVERFFESDIKLTRGITIFNDSTTVPLGKGFSSSAAVCVLVADAFRQVFSVQQNGEELGPANLMEIACAGEWKTGSLCGKMDQCVVFGAKTILSMKFRKGRTAPQISMIAPKNETKFHFVVADLCSSKNTKQILSDLQLAFENKEECWLHEPCFVVDTLTVADWPPSAKKLLEHIANTVNPKKSLRVFLGEENAIIVDAAKVAFGEGNKELLGALLTLSQYRFNSCLVPKCKELVAPKLHGVLKRVQGLEKKLSLGGKGVGSQGDGSVQFLCASAEAQKELAAYLSDVEKLNAFTFAV